MRLIGRKSFTSTASARFGSKDTKAWFATWSPRQSPPTETERRPSYQAWW
jgi:hypothetical protein